MWEPTQLYQEDRKVPFHLVESFSNMMLLACLFSLRLLQAAAGEPDVRHGMTCDPKNIECDQPSLGRQVTQGSQSIE